MTDWEVRRLAGTISEDPDVLLEQMGGSHPGSGTLTADEVPVAPGVWAAVTYEYQVRARGGYYAPTAQTPPESPTPQVGPVRVLTLHAYDDGGVAVRAADRTEEEGWMRAALDHFDDALQPQALEREALRVEPR